MKNIIGWILLTVVCSSCHSKAVQEPAKELSFWSETKKAAFLTNREDPATWDMELFKTDQEYTALGLGKNLPITNGIFPVSKYDLVGKGSFKGVGNYGALGGEGYEKKIGDKTILYNSFFIKESPVNTSFVEGKEDEVFFQLVVLTDFVDTVNYSHHRGEVISRNHPDYIGEGRFKTQQGNIDYVAFLAANRTSYALVNMRLFDLKEGKTILIAPQQDGSLRSMQVKSPLLSSQEIDAYTNKLLKDASVIAFFTQSENI